MLKDTFCVRPSKAAHDGSKCRGYDKISTGDMNSHATVLEKGGHRSVFVFPLLSPLLQ